MVLTSGASSVFFMSHSSPSPGKAKQQILHQITCQFAQLATLSLHQIDMGKQVLVSHAVYHIDKPVGLAVQIRLVNLLDVAREYHLRPFAGTCYNGFYFVRSKVLRFVDDAVGLAQAAPADKGEGFNDKLVAFLHIFQPFHFA